MSESCEDYELRTSAAVEDTYCKTHKGMWAHECGCDKKASKPIELSGNSRQFPPRLFLGSRIRTALDDFDWYPAYSNPSERSDVFYISIEEHEAILNETIEANKRLWNQLYDEKKELERKLALAREALEYYLNPAYHYHNAYDCDVSIAREALEVLNND